MATVAHNATPPDRVTVVLEVAAPVLHASAVPARRNCTVPVAARELSVRLD